MRAAALIIAAAFAMVGGAAGLVLLPEPASVLAGLAAVGVIILLLRRAQK